jgi:hypothetical protein
MKEKNAKYISCIICVIFVSSIIYFLSGMLIGLKRGPVKAEKEFNTLISQIENIHGATTFMSPEYINAVKYFIANNPYISAVLISSNNNVQFAYPISSNLITADNTGNPAISNTSSMIKTFSYQLHADSQTQILLSAAVYMMQPNDIYKLGRVSFLIILGATLFAFVCIFYLSLYEKDNNLKQNNNTKFEFSDISDLPDDTYSMYSKTDSISEFGELEDLAKVVDTNIESTTLCSSDPTIDSEKDLYDTVEISDDKEEETDNFSETDINKEKSPDFNMNFSSFSDTLAEAFEEEPLNEELSTSIEDLSSTDFSEQNDTEDNDVYEDELTNIDSNRHLDVEDDTEAYIDIENDSDLQNILENRLNNELEKASAFEQDLALLILRVRNLDKETTANERIETLLFDVFKYEGLVFQYKDDGYAGIMLETDLDEAMKIAENIYRETESILTSFNLENKIGIGLSTRNVRIIPAERLLNEAEKAVEHSFEEQEMPIVAFKVNPEKYRQYLSQQM